MDNAVEMPRKLGDRADLERETAAYQLPAILHNCMSIRN